MNKPDSLTFYFDYVDPWSLILSQRLQDLEEKGLVTVHRQPMEVNPPPNPLLDPEATEWRTRWDQAATEGARLGLEFNRPWIVPWTRKAHELAFHAQEGGAFEAIHEGLFRAYLLMGEDIGRVDVLLGLAREVGMDPMEVKAVLDVDRYTQTVEDVRARGIRSGVQAPPCLQWQGRILHGAATSEELQRFLTTDA